jgi:hypothetical protein
MLYDVEVNLLILFFALAGFSGCNDALKLKAFVFLSFGHALFVLDPHLFKKV